MRTTASLPNSLETWSVAKAARCSPRGVVVAQEIEAARMGAEVIADGGNAFDGAVATALALTVTEPWMSGLGGGGFAVVYVAAERRVRVIDFGMVAPQALDPADYPMTGAAGAEMFGWPEVRDDANIHGAKSIAVPGSVAGYSLAAKSFGRKSWSELLAPAIALAERGHRVTWWTTLQVAAEASILARYPSSAALWLPAGFPPSMDSDTAPTYLRTDALAQTLRTLADHGPRSFYEGPLARSIVADIQAAGGQISGSDLASYRARLVDPLAVSRGQAVYHLPAGLTAGPTFADALSRLPEFHTAEPDAIAYRSYATTLLNAYRTRLATMGHASESCTTHISAADAEGNLVLMTSTLLSPFGSRLLLPGSGVLMNNGINWFDPRPSRPNSMKAGARPLSNMCPMIATREGLPWFGYGASGGRKIMPAVFQLASFTNDFGMDLNGALAHPRIDAGNIDSLVHDSRMDDAIVASLEAVAPSVPWSPTTFPTMYACPSGVAVDAGKGCVGAAHPFTPVAGAATA